MKHAQIARRFVLVPLALFAILAVAAPPVWAVTLQEELDLGKRLNQEILKQTPLASDTQAQNEIDELGQALAKNVRRPEIKYHFRILRDNDLNAFSIPGGYVYFSDRMWNVLRRDERIGVLAHEIVHSDRRHALDAILKAQRRQIWIAVLLTAVKANNTWGNLADVAHQLYTLKYSRGDERQADEVGVELCHKAGFNPVGLLLAMRKISRFHDERGGEPPKIFSSHPPTSERRQYLTKLLQGMGLPIPPEDIKEAENPHKVGQVTAIEGDRIKFASSKPLERGAVIWLMGAGWDYHYEARTGVPIARGIVVSTGAVREATIWPMPTAKKNEIAKGAGVFAPPGPTAESGIGRMEPLSHLPIDVGTLKLDQEAPKLTRLFARQVVWNKDYTQLIYGSVGYVVLTGGPGESKFIAAPNPDYTYAPIAENSVLVRVIDPDQKRWLGPIVSIGRSGGTIEILTNRTRDEMDRAKESGQRFEVLNPAWHPKDSYDNRVLGRAVVKSLDKKMVLEFESFEPGFGMADIQIGLDVYEEPKPKPRAPKAP